MFSELAHTGREVTESRERNSVIGRQHVDVLFCTVTWASSVTQGETEAWYM